jgi:hypothetical protein
MLHLIAFGWMFLACGPVPVGTKDKGDAESDTGSAEETAISFGGIDIAPGNVDFGPVSLGSSAEATITLTNTDETESMISNAYVAGGDEFILSEDVELPLTLSGGASQALTIVFTPAELTRAHAILSVGVAGEVGYAEISLAGKGKEGGSDDPGNPGNESGPASLSVEPSSLDFGTVAVLNSSSETLALTNTGEADVLITGLNITNSAFTVSDGFSIPMLIERGSATTMPLTFAPEAEGLYEAILDIDTDPEEASLYVDLRGLGGESDCSICAPVLSLSTSTGGSTSLDLVPPFGYGCTANGSVVLTNSGDQTLDINNVNVRNDTISTCGEFSHSWAGSATLEPGSSTTVAVDYVADGSCLELPYPSLNQNVMHVRSTDPDQPDAVVELSATVLLCE